MPTECSQASLALRPARLLNRPMAAFVTRPRPAGLPRQTARPLPGPHLPTPGHLHQPYDLSDFSQALPEFGQITVIYGAILFNFGVFSVHQTHLSHRRPSFVEDQPAHVVGQIGQRDLRLGALDADGADEQPHPGLLLRKDMFNTGANF